MGTRLKISYNTDITDQNEILQDKLSGCKYRPTPFSASEIIKCSICDYELLTEEDERKVYHLKFSTENLCFDHEPGSTIGILPNNSEELVNKILIRLGLEKVADERYHLSVDQDCSNKKVSLPKHIPVSSTLRQVFLHNLDLNSVPKKLFLKRLIDYTVDETEREKLTFICSPKGSQQYQSLISSYSNRSLLAILETFPSCQPPIEVLLEYLPPLLPRPYSISSSSLCKEYLSITFNVDNDKKGVCSSWLENCIEELEKNKQCEVHIYLRIPSKFALPRDDSIPIIMIAAGTGISPFRSFLEHRHLRISEGASYRKSWLFYGCRDSTSNYLFKNDLKDYLASSALSRLSEAFSRESETKVYVQHELEKFGPELSSWIVHDGAVVYVCGDHLRVLPAVRAAFVKILKNQNFQEGDAEFYVEKMIKESRYIVDNWN